MTEPAANPQLSPPALRRDRRAVPVLWASAFVLAGLVTLQLGRLGSHTPGTALGGLEGLPVPSEVSRVGDYTVLTFNAGSDDVLAVLDGRGEELFLYRVKGLTQFEFLGRDKMADLFATAKRMGPGKK